MLGRYAFDIPPGTAVPHWAYQLVEVSRERMVTNLGADAMSRALIDLTLLLLGLLEVSTSIYFFFG